MVVVSGMMASLAIFRGIHVRSLQLPAVEYSLPYLRDL